MDYDNLHLEAYAAADLIPKLFPHVTPVTTLKAMMEITGNGSLNHADVHAILEHKPSSKQYVKYLYHKGFSPGFIQKYLGLHQTTVSYHLATEPKRRYQNPHLLYKKDVSEEWGNSSNL